MTRTQNRFPAPTHTLVVALLVLVSGTAPALISGASARAVSASLTLGNTVAATVDDTRIERDVTVASGALPGPVTEVTVTVDFRKVQWSCSNPGSSLAYNDEIGFQLTSPGGTTVVLAADYTTGAGDTTYWRPFVEDRAQVTFSDAASQDAGYDGFIRTGSYRPREALSAFDGEDPTGVWTLTVIDDYDGAPLCFFGMSLRLVSAGPPELPADALPDARVGVLYTAALPAVGDAISYQLANGSSLPDGLSLEAATGAIQGTPTRSGVFAFSATVRDADGTSPAVSFAITVFAPPGVTGPATVAARVGEAFEFVPVIASGHPTATTVVLAGALPHGLTFDSADGSIRGTPVDTADTYPVTLVAQNSAGASTPLEVDLALSPGEPHDIRIAGSAASVHQGGSLDFDVEVVDAGGNVLPVSSDIELRSSVATDKVVGFRVTFPTASPHLITATHVPSGLSAVMTVTVTAAVLGETGRSGNEALIVAALAAIVVGVGLVAVRGLREWGPNAPRHFAPAAGRDRPVAHPELLHHRAHRPRQVDARRPDARHHRRRRRP